MELLNEIRKARAALLRRIVKNDKWDLWCMPPETLIFKNPSVSPISEIKPGDLVLTSSGEFNRVIRVLKRPYSGDMIVIKPYYSDEVLMTPEHPVLVATNVRKKQKDTWRANLKNVEIR